MSSPSWSRSAVVVTLRRAGCVFAEEEADLLLAAATDADGLAAMIDRRVAGLPLEQILGWAEFCGLRIALEPGVFVPRRRTEFLVRRAVALAPARPVVVDLCCGSGALGVAFAAAVDGVELHAADVEPAAVRCAQHNVEAAGGRVHAGDLYAALPAGLRGRVDVLLANVPYVPSGEVGLMPPEARLHEPLVTLDGGPDGLAVLRRVADDARSWLAPGGRLFVESSEHQAPAALAALAGGGLVAELAADEEAGATVVIGRRHPPRRRAATPPRPG